MSNNHVQIVKDFFAAMGRGDKRGLLALSAEDIEWIIPGEDWPLAGTHRGHGESKPRTGRLRTVGSSPLPFEMAN
jgi:ketosteroid isomerase-like protein